MEESKMKKEEDIMKEKSDWITEAAKTSEKRIFTMIDEKVSKNTWEYWDNRFIPISMGNIRGIAKEVFEEKGARTLENEYPNVAKEVWEKIFDILDEELRSYGFKVGYNKSREFGIGPAEKKDIRGINEKNTVIQKIKSFLDKIKEAFSQEDEEDDF